VAIALGRRAPAVPAAVSPRSFAVRAWTPATKFETSLAANVGPAAQIASNAAVMPGSATRTAAS